jgi:hypothetical protein
MVENPKNQKYVQTLANSSSSKEWDRSIRSLFGRNIYFEDCKNSNVFSSTLMKFGGLNVIVDEVNEQIRVISPVVCQPWAKSACERVLGPHRRMPKPQPGPGNPE